MSRLRATETTTRHRTAPPAATASAPRAPRPSPASPPSAYGAREPDVGERVEDRDRGPALVGRGQALGLAQAGDQEAAVAGAEDRARGEQHPPHVAGEGEDADQDPDHGQAQSELAGEQVAAVVEATGERLHQHPGAERDAGQDTGERDRAALRSAELARQVGERDRHASEHPWRGRRDEQHERRPPGDRRDPEQRTIRDAGRRRPGCREQQHDRDQAEHDVRQVRHLQRVRRHLTDQPGDERAETEAGRQRDRGSPGRRTGGLVGGEVGDPGAGSGEHDSGAGAGEEAGNGQAGHRVVLDDQQHGRQRREHDERQHDRPPAPSVRRGAADQQGRDQPDGVDAEEEGAGLRRHPDLVAVGDEQGGELVGAPPDGEHREGHPLPRLHGPTLGGRRFSLR